MLPRRTARSTVFSVYALVGDIPQIHVLPATAPTCMCRATRSTVFSVYALVGDIPHR
jgi:hypothetical protein